LVVVREELLRYEKQLFSSFSTYFAPFNLILFFIDAKPGKRKYPGFFVNLKK